MFIMIGIIALLIYVGLVYYIGWRGYRWLRPEKSSRRFKILYTMVVAIAATSFIMGRISGITFLSKIGAYWMAIFYLFLLLVPVAHISVIVLRLTRLPRTGTQKWAGIVILVLTISLLIYGTYNAYNPIVRTYSIHMGKNTPSLDSLTIAMAADTHFGLLSGKDHAKRLVKEINGMKPDIILLPGDLIDDDIQPFLDQGIDEILSKLHAPFGVYATLGNHDRHNGTMQELIDTIERSGINVLYDEAVTIEDQLTLIGRKDRRDPDRSELNQIMKGVDLSKPVILLDHQPYDLDIAQKAGIDLMLSGHTHHGQVFPANLITDSIYENSWGYFKKGSMHSVVTEGFGFWGPPIRIGTRSEIVRIQVDFE
ncbi:metallophosphoesterase [Bacillus sp. FJAT-29937]|uniref:metallophosphoesterase n=1 Tax=Bacillus sp. FJAT-29937 TaxID=1720553 RepID=UPI000832FB96|nr:metallophosphoesterase [Bacillus sp. FJAT-29937]